MAAAMKRSPLNTGMMTDTSGSAMARLPVELAKQTVDSRGDVLDLLSEAEFEGRHAPNEGGHPGERLVPRRRELQQRAGCESGEGAGRNQREPFGWSVANDAWDQDRAHGEGSDQAFRDVVAEEEHSLFDFETCRVGHQVRKLREPLDVVSVQLRRPE